MVAPVSAYFLWLAESSCGFVTFAGTACSENGLSDTEFASTLVAEFGVALILVAIGSLGAMIGTEAGGRVADMEAYFDAHILQKILKEQSQEESECGSKEQ